MIKKLLKIYKKTVSWGQDFFSGKNISKINKEKEVIKDNFDDFIKKEETEIDELLTGKESFKKYRHDSVAVFKDYFIPSDSNDNRPKILRPKHLVIMAAVLLLLKISLVSYIFLVYQEKAEMSEAITSQILILTNESRTANNVSPLALNTSLNQAAKNKADDMLANNYFSHTSPDGRKPWDFVKRSDYTYILIGENLAMNFIAAADAHTALMASPSHQKNILNPKYSDIGLAVVSGQIDGKDTNVLVEIFGAKLESNIAKAEVPVVKPVASVEETEAPEISNPVDSNTPIVKSDSQTVSAVEVITKKEVVNSTTNVAKVEAKTDLNSKLKTAPTEVKSPNVVATPTQEVITPIETPTPEPVVASFTPLTDSSLTEQPIAIPVSKDQKVDRAVNFMKIAKIIYICFLIFLIIALLINILVRITVQHKKVIIQSIALIILVSALLLFDFGFMTELKNAATSIIIF